MKILIIRFSSIGDIIMMTPVFRCLKKQLGADIHFLTKEVFADITKHNPYLDKLIFLPDQLSTLIENLKLEEYDEVIDLHNNIRSNQITKLLGIPKKKINKLSLQKYLKIYTKIDRLPNTHVAHRAIDTVSHLGIVDDQEGMEMFIPETVYELPVVGDFISVALATAKFTKNIPESVFEDILAKIDKPILLLGSKSDQDLGDRLASKFKHVSNLAGQTSLLESAYIVQESSVFLGGDTGLLHIACALGKPTVSVWGATIPEFGVYPYYGKHQVGHQIHEIKLACRPCSKHGTQSCPKKHFNCMLLQNTQQIAESVHRLSGK